VHQGLKPENVLLDDRGNAKLADFGLTRVIETDPSKGMPQVFLGTGAMGYLPPELLAKTSAAGPESDVYSLGIVLYEMLTGMLPGRRSPLPSSVNRDVPQRLDPIFDRMTTDRREERYASVGAVLDDFYAAFPDRRFLKRGDLLLSAAAPDPSRAEAGGDEKPEEKKDDGGPKEGRKKGK
jgi:serine/threonine protein kinase